MTRPKNKLHNVPEMNTHRGESFACSFPIIIITGLGSPAVKLLNTHQIAWSSMIYLAKGTLNLVIKIK